jgi:hypothetical protein
MVASLWMGTANAEALLFNRNEQIYQIEAIYLNPIDQ